MKLLFGFPLDASPTVDQGLSRIDEEQRTALRELVRRGRETGEVLTAEYLVRHEDGSERWVESTAQWIHGSDGEPLYVQGVAKDITARKQMQIELDQYKTHLEELVESRTKALIEAKAAAEASNLAKSRFIAAASHDLRQPLAATNLYVDILKDAVQAGLARTVVQRIGASVESLTAMLDSLLDVARLDANAMQLRVSLVPVRQLARWLHEEFAEQFLMKGLMLRPFFPRRDLLLRTDETFIKGILRNLLVNALKYTTAGGVIVALRAQGSRFRFQVWDTGVGIEPQHLPHLFDEFFQVGNVERDSAKGMGLGLSIVRREAQLIGGTVDCRSRLGKGTVFELSLPREHFIDPQALPPLQGKLPDRLARAPLAGRRVCLVEDAPSVRDALTLLLVSWGMQVTAFTDAASALVSSELRSADFVITDFRLPGGRNGIELLQDMQRLAITPLRSVVLTGEIDLPDPVDPAGWPWPILRKPCGPDELWAALTG